MLESQVAYYLQRYLGAYVKGLDADSLKISVLRGDVSLSNLTLRPEALAGLDLPLHVRAGLLGRLTLKVPWTNLRGSPVIVEVDRLYILAGPAETEAVDGEDGGEEAAAEAEADAAAAAAALLPDDPVAASAAAAGTLSRTVAVASSRETVDVSIRTCRRASASARKLVFFCCCCCLRKRERRLSFFFSSFDFDFSIIINLSLKMTHFSMLCPSGRLAQIESTHLEGSKSGEPKSEGSSATVIFFTSFFQLDRSMGFRRRRSNQCNQNQ